ncbi:DUF3379 domain-containing protein [Roseobacter sp. YSTF-M11]|uniref:DUF3379 domain-containing protein n=1 Tax=Roseobacter insulae TaxID=2859783 RepID=A0A9X1FT04_9RHOB|nr:DUF3379 domain-containing protein [Roseobacter insulae]MBW4707180.1 DUF3379 domain-containing protein [Roseobacter insulae]
MMQDRYFTDEELVAFLDGENDLAPVEEIARAAASNAALVRRIDALKIDEDAIASSFDLLRVSSRPMPVLPDTPHRQPRFQIAGMALAASVALVVGLAAGAFYGSARHPGWAEYVASYQALYSNSTLAHVNQDQTAKQSELDRVAAAIGKTVAVDALQSFPEMEYKRAQVLSFKGRALIQLAFLTRTGDPVALCIIRTEGDATEGPVMSDMEGMSAARWTRGGFEYLLIGGSDDSLIRRVADTFSSRDI